MKLKNLTKSPKIRFLFLLAVLVLLNLIGSRTFFRIDLTSAKSYSLSAASKNLVRSLREPLAVHVFFSDNLPPPYNTNARYLRDLLTEYKGSAKGNFNFQFYNMKLPENESRAEEFGLRRLQIQEVSNNEVGLRQVWLGLALSYGDNTQLVDSLTSTNGLEYTLTTKIMQMISVSDTIANFAENENLTLTLYLSRSLRDIGINGLEECPEIVRDAFERANETYGGKIRFESIDLKAEAVAEAAEKFGVQKIEWQKQDGTTETGAVGLVVARGEDFRQIPLSVQRSLFGYVLAGLEDVEQSLKKNIDNLLAHITQIGYVVGQGEASLYDSDMTGAATLNSLIADTYSFAEINLQDGDIPEGLSSLVINGPKSEFSEAELCKIDQFVMKGGNLILFHEPFVQSDADMNFGEQDFTPTSTGLEKLFENYGVLLEKNYVLDENSYYTLDAQFGKMNLFWAPLIKQKQLAAKNPITKNLNYMLFLQSSSLSLASETKETRATVLVRSSPKSWTKNENIQLHPLVVEPPQDAESFAEQNLAVLLEGNFKSAFPTSAAESGVSLGQTLQKNIRPAKIFVAGSAQITTPQLIDENGTEPISLFVRNVLDYMNGKEELCQMRTKNLSLATLENVETTAALAAQYFNEFGLAILVGMAGLAVWKKRSRRRKTIAKRYQPHGDR